MTVKLICIGIVAGIIGLWYLSRLKCSIDVAIERAVNDALDRWGFID